MLLNVNGDFKKHRYRFQEAMRQQMLSANYHRDHEGVDVLDNNLRIKHFPSYITDRRAYCLDLMFYTANSLRLKAVGNPLNEYIESEVKWKEKCTERIDQWLENGRNPNTNKYDMPHLADYSGILALPIHQFPSDHLSMSGLFEIENVCSAMNGVNGQSGQCRCCLEQKVKRKLTKKEKKEQRKRKRKEQLNKERERNREEKMERKRKWEIEKQRQERIKHVLWAAWFLFGCKLISNRVR